MFSDYFFLVFLFSFFCCTFFSFSVIRADAKTSKNRRTVRSFCKDDDFLLWKFDFWVSVDRRRVLRKAHLRVGPLSCFSFILFLFVHFCFFLKKCCFLKLQYFQMCFSAGISISRHSCTFFFCRRSCDHAATLRFLRSVHRQAHEDLRRVRRVFLRILQHFADSSSRS